MIPVATILRRAYSAKQTTGLFRVTIGAELVFTSFTLELPWRNNEPERSCIPAGLTYRAKKLWSPSWNMKLFEFINTPGRSEVKFHPINYVDGLRGCVGLGKTLADINGDGHLDTTSSGECIKQFHAALEAYTEIDVVVVSGIGGNDHLRQGMHGYVAQ